MSPCGAPAGKTEEAVVLHTSRAREPFRALDVFQQQWVGRVQVSRNPPSTATVDPVM